MTNRTDARKVQLALDSAFSDLAYDPWLARKVLARARGEVQGRRKLSVGMAVVIALLLICAAALAVAALTHFFSDYAHMESAYGTYSEWPDSAKIHLVETMQASGLALDASGLEAFHAAGTDDAERARIATDMIRQYYGESGSMRTYNVMERELGAFGGAGWTAEDKALYSQLIKELGIGAEDQTLYAVPVQGADLTEREAVSAAKSALMSAYGLSEEDLSAYSVAECSFLEREAGTLEWLVRFTGKDDARYQNNVYSVRMARDGAVLETGSPWLTCSLNEAYDQLVAERGLFVQWTVAQKCAYASELPERIDAYVEQGGQPRDIRAYLHHLSAIRYGMPAESDLSEAESRAMAEAALKARCSVSDADRSELSAYPAFRMDAQGRWVWHWVFARLRRENADCGYFVDLDAATGEVLEVAPMIYHVDTNCWADFYEY